MKKLITPSSLQLALKSERRRQPLTIGFVPTMGALHEGHCALIRRSKKENSITVVSIFVNPTQFGPSEDFKRYPRPLAGDIRLLKREGADYLWSPRERDMYPEGNALFVDIQSKKSGTALMDHYCGKSRPGHFRGVLTICAKLFSAVKPDRVYMGAKDYQQTVIIDRLIREMHMGIQLIRVPTVREPDGLALSSRNVFLSPHERRRALMISKTLWMARDLLRSKRSRLETVLERARKQLLTAVDRVDYFEAADPVTLEPLKKKQKKMVLLTACYVGKTRLIDNVTMPV